MNRKKCQFDCRKCKKCTLFVSDIHNTNVKKQSCTLPSDFIPDHHTSLTYGIAFDLGTSTVAGSLWNLQSGTLIASASLPNYQCKYGSDVISRIMFCREAPDHLNKLQSLLIDCMNDIIQEICARNDISSQNITKVTLAGNSTISHLVLGIDPAPLAQVPFAPVFLEAQEMRARDLGIQTDPSAAVFLLPNIAGHVGSDIVSMMLATRFDTLKGNHIGIDIGTNGEVLAIKDGHILTCSAAAGPAFEGASIYHGMRASAGAIKKVEYKNYDIKINTIENQPPVGICGSGLIDAIACLLKCGIIDKNGRMLSQEEALDAHLPQTLVRRLTVHENAPAFTLAYNASNNTILLTQKDIREVQLAKGAIFAGIQTLMKALDMRPEELDSILIAGAFGSHIEKDNALKIGLLPLIPAETIILVGNAAGTGASMALLSDKERIRASEIAKKVHHVELSTSMDFQEFYIKSMQF